MDDIASSQSILDSTSHASLNPTLHEENTESVKAVNTFDDSTLNDNTSHNSTTAMGNGNDAASNSPNESNNGWRNEEKNSSISSVNVDKRVSFSESVSSIDKGANPESEYSTSFVESMKNFSLEERIKKLNDLLTASNKELKEFEKANGVDVLSVWLQDFLTTNDTKNAMTLVKVLDRLPMSISTLKQSKIGKQCNTLLKEGKLTPDMRKQVSKLVSKWKQVVMDVSRIPKIPKKKVETEAFPDIPKKKPSSSASIVSNASNATTSTNSSSSTNAEAASPEHDTESESDSRKRKRDIMEEVQRKVDEEDALRNPKRKVKRVRWASPDNLEQIRVYEVVRDDVQQIIEPEALKIDGDVLKALKNPNVIDDILNTIEMNKNTSTTAHSSSGQMQSHATHNGSYDSHAAPYDPNAWNQWNYGNAWNPSQAWNPYPQPNTDNQGYVGHYPAMNQMNGMYATNSYMNQPNANPYGGNYQYGQWQNWNGYQY